MPSPDVDASRIVATLLEHQVSFVVIGGFAVELWDVAVPPTIDVDITPERSRRNLERLAAALNVLDARLRAGREDVEVPGGFTAANIESASTLNLMTDAGPVDVNLMPAGTDGFDDLIRQATDIEFEGLLVPTADLADVARSKEAAGRPKDIKTLPAIHAHLGQRRRRQTQAVGSTPAASQSPSPPAP